MLRYNVRNDGGWATLEEEMKYIYDFLSIHNYRNKQRVNTVFHIAEQLLDTPVMKLIIQPLIENSLKYGWKPFAGQNDFELSLSIFKETDHLNIEIRDNGAGIPDDVLAMLQALTQSEGETSDPFFKKHTGILNVYRRYVLVYGDGFNMNITCNEKSNKGTSIHIRIPIV